MEMRNTEMSEEYKQDPATQTRIGELERQSAAQSTDIRGIYAGLDEIRDVLVRMQESAKPNVSGMFMVLLATCAFLVTIGGLSMAPVYRDLTRLFESKAAMTQTLAETAGNRFTASDGEGLEAAMRAEMHLLETQIATNQENIAWAKGYLEGKDL